MPNGGSDCCGTCPFNEKNSGKSKDHFCEIRNFKIEIPYWTYCNNHPRRNPLLSRAPRGPVWAAVYDGYDRKLFREDLQIPPELLPPVGDAMYVRIPYYRNTRPLGDSLGVCSVCGEQCEDTISLEPLGEDKKFFCSTAHYFEWWLSSPEAVSYRNKAPLDTESLKNKFQEISENLSDAGTALLTSGGREQIMELLAELDDLRVAMGYGDIDMIHAAIYLDAPEIRGDLFPNILTLQINLTRAGAFLQQEPMNKEEILDCLSDIRDVVQKILAEDLS